MDIGLFLDFVIKNNTSINTLVHDFQCAYVWISVKYIPIRGIAGS